MIENELTSLLKTLTQLQIEFVAARLSAKSDKEAAEIVGISPNTVYSWPNKDDVAKVVKLAKLSSLEIAREKLSRLVLQAVNVLEEEMCMGKKLTAACEVLDRAGLVAVKGLDVTTKGQKLDGDLADDKRVAGLMALYDVIRARLLSQIGDGESDMGPPSGTADGDFSPLG